MVAGAAVAGAFGVYLNSRPKLVAVGFEVDKLRLHREFDAGVDLCESERQQARHSPEVELRAFMEQHGAVFSSNVEVAEARGKPRGLYSIDATADVTFSVPRSLMLCTSDITARILLPPTFGPEDVDASLGRSLLALFVAAERARPGPSFWSKFVCSLPPTFRSEHPLYAPDADLLALQASDFERILRCEREVNYRYFERTCKIIAQVPSFHVANTLARHKRLLAHRPRSSTAFLGASTAWTAF
jgi:hypothetical protein